MEPFILHLDADAFFASIEQRDDPKLRDKPVAVGTGVVASCSYEARRHGVRTGMRLAEARGLCRDLLVIPGEYPRYEQAARRMLGVCLEQTPVVEAAALDDLYLDLTKHHQPESVAGQLRAQIHDESYLAPWPANVLPGVGHKVGGRLQRLNVQRVGEVAAMPVPILTGLFGK